MLGRFLELAVVTADPQGDWELFQRLGFTPAETGDIWSHSYGVVCCSGLALGFHSQGDEPLSVCTVRPNVLELHRELEEKSVEVENAQLGPDVFNQLALREPTGVAMQVLEARTFAPPAEFPVRTMLGRFEHLSLPSQDMDAVAGFWSRLGYDTHEASPLGGIEIESGLPLGYHPVGSFPDPVLVFQGDGQEREINALLACGLERSKPLPAMAGVDHVLLGGPGGIRLLLLA